MQVYADCPTFFCPPLTFIRNSIVIIETDVMIVYSVNDTELTGE